MIHPGIKSCDRCRDVVARRDVIFFTTVKDYVTVRSDDVTTYVNMESNTTAGKLHYCRECWEALWDRYCKDRVGV